MVKCYVCRGRGVDKADAKCARCKGTGEVVRSNRGAGPGERRGGRGVGGLNKKTLVRNLLADVLNEPDTKRLVGAIVKEEVVEPETPAQKKAVKVLGEFMSATAGIAARYQNELVALMSLPTVAGEARKRLERAEGKYVKFTELTALLAGKLAPFESPTYRAVVVSSSPGTIAPAKRPGDDAKVIQMLEPVAISREYQRIMRGNKAG